MLNIWWFGLDYKEIIMISVQFLIFELVTTLIYIYIYIYMCIYIYVYIYMHIDVIPRSDIGILDF